MKMAIIAAMDENGFIGKGNELPWKLASDMSRFKRVTEGDGFNSVIMGRKTWDSLPIKPLPNRYNVVISSKNQSNVDSYTSIELCIENLKKNKSIKDVFIIGGMSVYKYFYKYAQTLHITFINKIYPDTDTFFPIDIDQIKIDFKCVSNEKIIDELSFTKWTKK